jgi:hypothetical protein
MHVNNWLTLSPSSLEVNKSTNPVRSICVYSCLVSSFITIFWPCCRRLSLSRAALGVVTKRFPDGQIVQNLSQSVWSMEEYFYLFTRIITFFWYVVSINFWLITNSGYLIRRHLLWNTRNFKIIVLTIFHVSDPYRKIAFTLLSKICSLVAELIRGIKTRLTTMSLSNIDLSLSLARTSFVSCTFSGVSLVHCVPDLYSVETVEGCLEVVEYDC